MRDRRFGAWLGLVAIVGGLVLVALLTARTPDGVAFGLRSAAPDGFRAISAVLAEEGATVRELPAATVASSAFGPGDVLFVAEPAFVTEDELDAMEEAAARGATLVYGSPVDSGGEFGIDHRTLADTPAVPVPVGTCTIAELVDADLGDVDAAFTPDFAAIGDEASCYGRGRRSLFAAQPVGDGQIVTIASPYLWVNARLQPDKEDGGMPLSNAATAVALLQAADGATITFVEPVPSEGIIVEGSQSVMSLLPFGVKLALAQLVVAFAFYLWWRSRRLGAPVADEVPVQVAGSELVVAVGDMLRRKGSTALAATQLRADCAAVLSNRLGVPPGAPLSSLIELAASRSGREPETVSALLADPPVGRPVESVEALVGLSRSLDSLRQEVLDVVATH